MVAALRVGQRRHSVTKVLTGTFVVYLGRSSLDSRTQEMGILRPE